MVFPSSRHIIYNTSRILLENYDEMFGYAFSFQRQLSRKFLENFIEYIYQIKNNILCKLLFFCMNFFFSGKWRP